MSFQTPKPVNIPGPGKKPGIPGRFPGPQPGARPGLPKPKNPALIGGKPMVPISNLIQFTPKFESESPTQNSEPLSNGLPAPSEEKINGIHKDNVEDREILDSQSKEDEKGDLQHGETKSEKVDDTINKGLEIDPKFQGSRQIKVEANHDTISETQLLETGKSNISHQLGKDDDKLITFGIQEKEQENPNSEDNLKRNEEQNLLEEIKRERNTKTHERAQEESFPRHFQDNYHTSHGFPNMIKEEEESGEQNHSPVMRERKVGEEYQEGRSTQDDPSSGLSQGKDILEAYEGYGEILKHSNKGLEVKKEEDSTLLAQLKTLSLELEKEKKEKNALRTENEKIMNENMELKNQLIDLTHKLEGLQKKNAITRDLARKEEEIKRLKNEIKSTMEGSRLITEHSNRVISESTKYKEETEVLIASLEKEKEELHKKFIDYKKEAQLNYISKLVGLQEKIDYLENKNREYENEIERYQVDLKQKTNIIHKLAHINNEVQSTVSYWPTFYPPQPQPVSESKSTLIRGKDQDPAFVEVNKSPVLDSIFNQEVQEIKEETKQEIQIETDQSEKVEKEEEGINVQIEKNNNFEEEPINVQIESKKNFEQVVELGENIVNEQFNFSNEDAQLQNTTEEEEEVKEENPPLSDKNEILEENQENLETQQFQENIEIEHLENAWGVEEPILIENEQKQQEEQEKLQELPLENKAFTTEPEEQNNVEVHQTIENESPPVELTHDEEPPKFSEKIEEKEEKPAINTLTVPPSNRLLQKKKKAGPPPRQFVGFKPTATAFEPIEEPIHPQVEEVHDNASGLVHTVNEETDKQPPMNSFVGFKPSAGKIPFKRPNPPQFNQPFLNNAQQNIDSDHNGHQIDSTSEKVQPLQEEGISLELNVDAVTKTSESKNNLETDKNSNTSFEQRDSSSTRKLSSHVGSKDDLDGNEPQETKPKINSHGKPVKVSKAIKKKEPIGSIYS